MEGINCSDRIRSQETGCSRKVEETKARKLDMMEFRHSHEVLVGCRRKFRAEKDV